MPKKNDVKIKFKVSLKSLYNLGGEEEGKNVFVTWKRGNKSKNKGESKKVPVKKGMAMLGDEFELDCTLFQDAKTRKFDSKKLEIVVKREDGKRGKDLGKVTVELGEYGTAGDYDSLTFPLGAGKSSKKKGKEEAAPNEPGIKLSIKSTWTHFNKKLITKSTGGENGKRDRKNTITIGDEEYDLQTVDESESEDETTAGDLSEEESEESEDEGLKEMKGRGSKKKEKRGSKSLSTSSSSSSTRSSSSEPLESSPSSTTTTTTTTTTTPSDGGEDAKELKKRLATAEKEKNEKDKQVKKYEAEINRMKEELAKEKEKAKEKMMKATGQTQELKKLKKELAEAKRHSGSDSTTPAPPPHNDHASAEEIKSLRGQLEASEANRARLEAQLKEAAASASAPAKAQTHRALEDLRTANEELERTKRELERLKKDQEQQQRSLRDELDKERKKTAKLQKEASESKAALDDKEAELKQKTELFVKLKEQFQALKESTRKDQERLMELEQKDRKREASASGGAAAAQRGGGKKNKTLEEAESAIDYLKDIERLEKSLLAAQRELEEAKEKHAEEVAEWKKELDKAQRHQLRSGGGGSSSAGADSNNPQEVQRLQAEIRRLQEENHKNHPAKQLKSEADSLAKENRELKQQIDKQEKEVKTLQKRLADSAKEAEKLQQQLAAASKKKGGDPSDSSKKDQDGGGGGGDAMLKSKLKKLEEEKDESSLIEDYVYCMSPKYEDGTHASAVRLTEKLMQRAALDDPPNERLLAKVVLAVKKASQAASVDIHSLTPWFGYATMLHEQLENEVGTSEDENSGDLPENGVHIPREGEQPEDEDDPVAMFFHNLELLIFDIYSTLIRHFYTQLNETVIPAILYPQDKSHRSPENKSVSAVMNEMYDALARHFVFDSIKKQFFSQVFYYINACIFNSLLKKRDLCTCGTGFQVKMGLSQLEEWVVNCRDKKLLLPVCRQFLAHITEAANVLVVDKEIFADESMISSVFPTLNVAQVKHLLDSFHPDQFSPAGVSRSVLTSLDEMVRSNDDQLPLELDESLLIRLPKN